ncbi:hypothetical protein RAS12_26965 [Achromobacter seleniivolatilans]|uniref:Type II secretion system protein GspC N-terminal domain-containing protein n=1 Tax=Achromobacter seleniivolatilans TaxID=3047478 RepID=A0ABY9M0R1_9BURK|nr:hypothetical protein [Achromobacter sp. R39]WMD20208.1 hypothetical protein RAS12_26965 [Achromobacter sp. R39]
MTDYRRLFVGGLPFLVLVLGMGGLWLHLLVSEEDVRWPEADSPGVEGQWVQPPAAVRTFADLQTYSAIWERPLFSEQRKPDFQSAAPTDVPPPGVDDLTLTGVILAPPMRRAWLKQRGGQILSLKEGDLLPNGWSLIRIEDRKIEISYGAHRHILTISSLRLPTSSQ